MHGHGSTQRQLTFSRLAPTAYGSIACPAKKFGAVMGLGAVTAKKTRTDSGALVKYFDKPKPDAPEFRIDVSSTIDNIPDQVMCGAQLALLSITRNILAKIEPDNSVTYPPHAAVTMNIPDTFSDAVCQNLEAIQKESKATVQVFQDNQNKNMLARTDEFTVQFSGQYQQICWSVFHTFEFIRQACKELIASIAASPSLSQPNISGHSPSQGPHSSATAAFADKDLATVQTVISVLISVQQASGLIGSGGRHIQQIRKGSKCTHITVHNAQPGALQCLLECASREAASLAECAALEAYEICYTRMKPHLSVIHLLQPTEQIEVVQSFIRCWSLNNPGKLKFHVKQMCETPIWAGAGQQIVWVEGPGDFPLHFVQALVEHLRGNINENKVLGLLTVADSHALLSSSNAATGPPSSQHLLQLPAVSPAMASKAALAAVAMVAAIAGAATAIAAPAAAPSVEAAASVQHEKSSPQRCDVFLGLSLPLGRESQTASPQASTGRKRRHKEQAVIQPANTTSLEDKGDGLQARKLQRVGSGRLQQQHKQPQRQRQGKKPVEESAAKHKGLVLAAIPQLTTFTLSGMTNSARVKFAKLLTENGRTYVTAHHEWCTSIQAILMTQLARTDTTLAGLAQGVYMLRSKYLLDCIKHGTIIHPREYELQNCTAPGHMFEGAPSHWQQRAAKTGTGAWSGFKVVLIGSIPSPLDRACLTRVILAGGGLVVPATEQTANDQDLLPTIAVVEPQLDQSSSVLKALLRAGVPCVRPSYVQFFLTHPKANMREHYLHPECWEVVAGGGASALRAREEARKSF